MGWTIKGTVRGLVTAAWLAASITPAAADCIPWKEAGSIVAENSLIPANVIYKSVQSHMGGKIIHANLCEEGGKFFYKLVVLGAQGEVSKVKVDARTGQF